MLNKSENSVMPIRGGELSASKAEWKDSDLRQNDGILVVLLNIAENNVMLNSFQHLKQSKKILTDV
jgi:hypothetical protein